MKKIWILCFIILKNFSQTQCVLKPRSLSLVGVQSKTKLNKSNFMRPWEDVLNKKFNLVICIRNGFPVSLINSLLCCEISYNSGPKEPEKWSPLRFWQVYTEVKTFSIKGMETFRGQWHLVDTIFQNGRLLVDIPKGWLFVDTFGDISWTILVRLSKHCSVPG